MPFRVSSILHPYQIHLAWLQHQTFYIELSIKSISNDFSSQIESHQRIAYYVK